MDISALTSQEKDVPRQMESLIDWRVYDVDFLASAYTGVETAGAHDLFPIAIGEVCVGGYGIVLTAFAGSGATVRFDIAGTSCTGILPVAQLAAGDVITFSGNDIDGVAGILVGYDTAAADHFGATVATASLTAGRMLFCLQYLDVANFIANG